MQDTLSGWRFGHPSGQAGGGDTQSTWRSDRCAHNSRRACGKAEPNRPSMELIGCLVDIVLDLISFDYHDVSPIPQRLSAHSGL